MYAEHSSITVRMIVCRGVVYPVVPTTIVTNDTRVSLLVDTCVSSSTYNHSHK